MAEGSPQQAALSIFLTVSHGFERRFWSQPSTARHVLFWDRVGLLMGMAMHVMMDISNTPWYANVKPYIIIGPLLQLLQLSWATCHSKSYMAWRQSATLVQRLRWFVISTLILASLPSETFMASFLELKLNSSREAWQAVVRLITLFATPPIFVVLVHGLPFRFQLGAAALHAVQHVAYTLRHQDLVISRLGLQPQLSRVCHTMYMVLDPSMSFPLHAGPTWCSSPEVHGWLLLYIHMVVACIIPLHLIHTAEYNSKVRYLHEAASTSPLEIYVLKPWHVCFMQCWASCSLAWGLLVVVCSVVYR